MRIFKVLLLDDNTDNTNFFKVAMEKWHVDLVVVSDVENSLIRINIIKPDLIMLSTDLSMNYEKTISFLVGKRLPILFYGRRGIPKNLEENSLIKGYFPIPINVLQLKNKLFSTLNPSYQKEHAKGHIDVVVNEKVGVVELEGDISWEQIHQLKYQIIYLFEIKEIVGIVFIFYSLGNQVEELRDFLEHLFEIIKGKGINSAYLKYLSADDKIIAIFRNQPVLNGVELVKSFAEAFLKIQSVNLDKASIGMDVVFLQENVKLVENVYDEYGNLIKQAGDVFTKEDLARLKSDGIDRIYYPKELSYLGLDVEKIAGVSENIQNILIQQADFSLDDLSRDKIKSKDKLIVIIDDDPLTRTILSKAIKKLGYSFKLADNGVDGLKLAIQYNPDLILLDLMIPKMNGPQFIKKYRELRQKHLSPIVVVSAVSRSDVIQPILKMGVKDYILKPISLEMLNEKITRNIL